MRAEWIPGDVMGALLAAMMPANALALEASMATGLRIGDVLAITRQQCARGRFTVPRKDGQAPAGVSAQEAARTDVRPGGAIFCFRA